VRLCIGFFGRCNVNVVKRLKTVGKMQVKIDNIKERMLNRQKETES